MKGNRNNYCTNCGYLHEANTSIDKCPICSDRNHLTTYDTKYDKYVRQSVKGNLAYPDQPGWDWGHPNSSLSRHVRAAVFNATTNNNRK